MTRTSTSPPSQYASTLCFLPLCVFPVVFDDLCFLKLDDGEPEVGANVAISSSAALEMLLSREKPELRRWGRRRLAWYPNLRLAVPF